MNEWRQPFVASPRAHPDGPWPERIADMNWRRVRTGPNRTVTDDATRDADAAFIAHARADVPRLCEAVEAAAAERAAIIAALGLTEDVDAGRDLVEACQEVTDDAGCVADERERVGAALAASEARTSRLLAVLHDIAGSYAARRHLTKSHLTVPLRESMQKKALTDERIEKLAIDTWESVVREQRG